MQSGGEKGLRVNDHLQQEMISVEVQVVTIRYNLTVFALLATKTADRTEQSLRNLVVITIR